MVRELVHDPILLARKSEPAGEGDLDTAQDLLDTLMAHKDGCVGMAANMIGVCKQIIVFDNEGSYMVMLNPKILKASGEYDTEEGCLSLLGGPRKTKRYQKIKNTRICRCRNGSKASAAGRHRSSSMRWTTVRGF